ncbi:MAG: Rieske (2Fe-2S) protein [Sphingomonadaceae bacterium]
MSRKGLRLAPIAEVTPGFAKVFDVEGQTVLLVCGEKGARAIRNLCPHAGAPLEGGRVSGNRFRCPRHGYIFDLDSGVSKRGPEEGFGPLQFLHLWEADGYYVTDGEWRDTPQT